ncbi:serine hydrolase [Luteimonas fraxinea]|uniref:Beta-lactamase n=1 Tax=Luteimonas fraxinea TaxID=2901869 RepID=A0ABS8UBB1_9GAMM|nr:serine hydrolase [Luteimonas fraxinea]MCD9096041.1 serine hydrolase [Luteimonas fraxinea]MCD9124630.1 serine hydrolase [Luteimonas fraxinea]UHH10788.1 serine hydrolase [Luteimonas fraxinea]
MLPNTLTLAAMLAISGSASATTDAALAGIVDQRLAGDRTGACFSVALIDGDSVARTYRCADGTATPRIGTDSAFEIGSVSKTMTAALLAQLIADGQASLDDPLSAYLPAGTAVPTFEGQPILLRHVVTHTSGLPALPARMQITNPADPYAALTPEALLASLGDVTLTRAPGTQFEYSNFASMLLSYAVAQRAGQPFEALIDAQLFAPLGMTHAYIAQRPDGVRAAVGHLPNGSETPAWTIPGDMAGVGGVRATLDDMVRYVQGQLGHADGSAAAPLLAALQTTQQPVSEQPPMAMNWMIAPLAGRSVLMHEGGTGGFSSLVGFDPERRRGVVILSDTSLTALGGLGSLGAHLLDPSAPVGKPRKLATPPSELVDGLVGTWQLSAGMQVELARKGDALTIHPAGQPIFELGYDDAGDFFPVQFDALLSPKRAADGSYSFVWHQGGGAMAATRATDAAPTAAQAPDVPLADYAGDYTLMPGFALKVDSADGRLRAQATGQGAFPLDATGADTFAAPAFGIELRFQRGTDGEVTALELHQAGQVLRGARG